MSFESTSALAADQEFAARLSACIHTENRASADPWGQWVMTYSMPSALYMPWVATAPGFADAYMGGGQAAITDGEILAAVQATTPAVQAAYPRS